MSYSLKRIFTLKLSLLILCFFLGSNYFKAIGAQEYHLGTYNTMVHQKSWPNRAESIANLVLYNDFDIFGAQEVAVNQFKNLNQSLKEVYSSFGVGREDGKNQGEHNPIFYKRNKFNLMSSGVFWLSQTPDTPSKGWDAEIPRICTWIKLQDKDNNTEIWFFNTHFDHRGIKARVKSCNLILRKIKQICPDNANIVLTGDFNVNQDNEVYNILTSSNLIQDSYSFAKYKWVPTGTFYGNILEKPTRNRIDHIFVSKTTKVLRYGILNNFIFNIEDKAVNDSGLLKQSDINKKEIKMLAPSDHFPVSVFVEFEKPQKSQKETIGKSLLKKILK